MKDFVSASSARSRAAKRIARPQSQPLGGCATTRDMLARTPAAAKKRAYRRRLRAGRIVLKLEVSEADLAEAMIAAERLTEAETTRRDALNRAAEGVLTEWCERWRHKS